MLFYKQHEVEIIPPEILLNDVDQLNGNFIKTGTKQSFTDSKLKANNNGFDSNAMDSDNYGLIDDIFLVNELNPSCFNDSLGGSPTLSASDDELKEMIKSTIDERKPFESFEKQITITVPQPPPLSNVDSFLIGGCLFDGKLL